MMKNANLPKKIVMTGGGSAGHVTPNLALIPLLQAKGWSIDYIGSMHGPERTMIEQIQIPYHAIATGKLRRYFSWQNFLDPARVLLGIWQAFCLLQRIKPRVVFSKGGFVALPVVIGAWILRIPVVVHESDFSIGLANRLSFPFVDKICVTFEAARQHIPDQNKVIVTGTPIRASLLNGDRDRGLRHCGLDADKPCLLVIGGGQGSQTINHCVRQALPTLLQSMHVIHLCGPGKIDPHYQQSGYVQIEYANTELADLFAASDCVISRAGANSLYELLVLAKPHILIPLPCTQSRGDQIENAQYFERLGVSHVIPEAQLSVERLIQEINLVQKQKVQIIQSISALHIQSAVEIIVDILENIS